MFGMCVCVLCWGLGWGAVGVCVSVCPVGCGESWLGVGCGV